MRSWRVVKIVFTVLITLQSSTALAASAVGLQVDITIDATATGKPFNPLLLGNNLEWQNRGDTLLLEDGSFEPNSYARVKKLAPTLLRFPGGSQADIFEWEKSVGPLASRGAIPSANGKGQRYMFGIDEFLALTSQLGMQRIFTLNVLNAGADSAAALVTYVKTRGGMDFWEIGNEPYLKIEGNELAQTPANIQRNITPEEFTTRVNAVIHAVRKVDPKARVGIPLRSDVMNNIPSPYRGFNDILLSGLKEPIDFVTLHSAYMPQAFFKPVDEKDMYLAAVAGAASVKVDMEATRAQLARYFPNRSIPLAFTEYNAFFTIGKPTDGLITSLAGALYVADVLRLFAEDGNVLMANFWSLIDNWHFGAIEQNGNFRPAYYVLAAYRTLAEGMILPVTTLSPEFDSPSVGFSMAAQVPWVTSMSVRKGRTIFLVLINRHPESPATVSLTVKGANLHSEGKSFILNGPEVFAGAEGRQPVSWTQSAFNVTDHTATIEIAAHSFTLLALPVK